MTIEETQKIFKQCERFFGHHYPVNLKDQFKKLAEEVSIDESSEQYSRGKNSLKILNPR